MKMFPHSFVPRLHVNEKAVNAACSAPEGTATFGVNRARVMHKKPISLDVEKAVQIRIPAQDVHNEAMRQIFRLEIIKAMPAESIDWETVDWVRICPFKSSRH